MAGNRDAYEQAMSAGHNAAWDEDWDAAIRAYGRAVQEFPDDPEAHLHLGLALLHVGRLNDALKVYSRCHQLDPDDPIPLEKSAEVLERLGRQREAAQQYINVAEIYYAQRDFDKTIANWERATHLSPGLIAIHGKLAQLRERLGDTRGAVREYLTLAYYFQRMNDNEKALMAAQRALRLERNNPQVLNTIQALEAGSAIVLPQDDVQGADRPQTGSLSGAIEREAPEVETDTDGPLEEAMRLALTLLASHVMETGSLEVSGADALKAMELQRQEQWAEAVAAYRRAAHQIRHPALSMNLGALLLDEQPDEAVPYLTEAILEPRLEAGAYYGLGEAYHKAQKHLKAAQALIQSARAVDRDLAPTDAARAEIETVYKRLLEMLEGRSDEALIAVWQRYQRLMRGRGWKQRIAETRGQIAETMREQGEEGAFEILVASHGDELTEAIARIDHFTRTGMLTLAMDEAHRAIELSPYYLPVHLRMAEIMMREGRIRQAINKYAVVARTFLVRGEYERSRSVLLKVLEMAPLDIGIRQTLIELLEAEQQWLDAIDQYIELANAYNQLGNFEQARDTLNLAERLGRRVNAPVDTLVRIKHHMADIDQMRLDSRRAQKTYEEIIQLKPDDERAYRMLIELNYRQGNHLDGIRRLDQLLGIYAREKQTDKITKLLEELVSLYSKDTALRMRLAAVYRQLGRKEDAIAQLDALGELQLQAGMNREAAKTIRQIISLNPAGVEDYQRLLAQLGG